MLGAAMEGMVMAATGLSLTEPRLRRPAARLCGAPPHNARGRRRGGTADNVFYRQVAAAFEHCGDRRAGRLRQAKLRIARGENSGSGAEARQATDLAKF